MKRALMVAVVVAGLTGAGVSISAADVRAPIEVNVAAGAAAVSLKGLVRGDGSIEYRLPARAGQTLFVRLRSRHANRATFNIMAPGLDTALFNGNISGNAFADALPVDGTYVVQVFLVRAAARRDESTDFTIDFRLADGDTPAAAPAGGEAMPPVPKSDFADGYGGGPDFWAVAGIPAGDTLNLRAEPSAQAQIILKLDEGAVVRNLGCRPIDGGRWCRVALTGDADATGWVNGRYLREAAPPAAARDAKVAGTPYHATGQIPCTLKSDDQVRSCSFGVIRAGRGGATLDVTFPDSFKRTLVFKQGMVTTTAPGDSVQSRRDGDSTIVTVDGIESFTVPDAVVDGG